MQPQSIRPHGTRVAPSCSGQSGGTAPSPTNNGRAATATESTLLVARCSHRLGATAKPARYLLALLTIASTMKGGSYYG